MIGFNHCTHYTLYPTVIMKDDFISSGRSVSNLKAHLVLTTKYRRKVFTEEMLQS
jgi:hypothetical protein